MTLRQRGSPRPPREKPGSAPLPGFFAFGLVRRRLADDVVDAGLMAIFGPLLSQNNVSPGLTTDNVGENDRPFQTTFPYLADPHTN